MFPPKNVRTVGRSRFFRFGVAQSASTKSAQYLAAPPVLVVAVAGIEEGGCRSDRHIGNHDGNGVQPLPGFATLRLGEMSD